MTDISIDNDINIMSDNSDRADNTSYNTSILIDGCKQMGIRLTELQEKQFITYYKMLVEKNKVMNLTAVTEWEEVETKHYLDSLLLNEVKDLSSQMRVLDLGTGAGFPGIPLKIVFPQLNLVLADSLNKRILFLDEVIQDLGLEGIKTVHARAEDLGRREGYRESFDLVLSRAVANLSSLAEYCIPFVKKNGFFISYKSVDIENEVIAAKNAVRILGGGKPETVIKSLPCTEMERAFVMIKKVKETPKMYPRKAGTPSKNPL